MPATDNIPQSPTFGPFSACKFQPAAIPFTPVTAAEIARLVNARRIGPDSWVGGHCPLPAHRRGDIHGGLSIRQCDDKTLIFCHSCGRGATPEIVRALGLSMGALFRPLTPQERARLRRERIVRQGADERRAQAEREVAERCRLLTILEDALFERLLIAEGTEADELAKQWHETLTLGREVKEAGEALHPLHIPTRCSTCLSDRCPHWQAQVARWWPHGERLPVYPKGAA